MVQQALILAAGMGKRLGKYTQNGTKCMVRVHERSLIERALEALEAVGIQQVVIVIGYRGEQLKAFLKDKFPKISIIYVENPIYDKTNNIYSLYLAKEYLASQDTLLLESDLIFEKEIIQELIDSPFPNLAVISHFEPWMDGTVTMLDHEDNIVSVVDKAHFDWDKTSYYFKTVNIYKFSKDFSRKYYLPFLDAYLKAFGDNEYYEQVLKVLAFLEDSGLKGFKVAENRWYEIDDPQDLAVAETIFSDYDKKLELMQSRYGGYWRFPSMLDFCYLVNPYFPPQRMIDEIQSSFKELMGQYPSGAKVQSGLAAKVFGTAEDQIVVGNGAAELIAHLFGFISGTVGLPTPSFNEYAERIGKDRCVAFMPEKHDFSYTLEELIVFCKKRQLSSLVLINPDNPTGHFLSKNAVEMLVEETHKLGITLIVDESFVDFSEQDKRFTLLSERYLEQHPNLMVIKSISKSYGVPGFRLGILATGNIDLAAQVRKHLPIWNINSFGEFFLQIVDKYKKDYTAACNAIVAERQRFTEALGKIPGLKVFPSQANYLLVELQHPIGSKGLTEKLLNEHKLFVKDLSSKAGFPKDKQYLRFAVRNEEDNNKLITALKGMLL